MQAKPCSLVHLLTLPAHVRTSRRVQASPSSKIHSTGNTHIMAPRTTSRDAHACLHARLSADGLQSILSTHGASFVKALAYYGVSNAASIAKVCLLSQQARHVCVTIVATIAGNATPGQESCGRGNVHLKAGQGFGYGRSRHGGYCGKGCPLCWCACAVPVYVARISHHLTHAHVLG